jgi:hypothetical protein
MRSKHWSDGEKSAEQRSRSDQCELDQEHFVHPNAASDNRDRAEMFLGRQMPDSLQPFNKRNGQFPTAS